MVAWRPDFGRRTTDDARRGGAPTGQQFCGKDGDVDAVRGVDLAVETGSVFGFLGPNGAGKSTTVEMLTTLMTITSGTARVAGVDVTADPYRARLRALMPFLSVRTINEYD